MRYAALIAVFLLALCGLTFAANINIDGLPAASSAAGADLIECEQSGTNRKCTLTQATNLTSVATACPASAAQQGSITLAGARPITTNSGASYTPASTNNYDCGNVVVLTNGSATTVTLPQAGTGGFVQGNLWFVRYCFVASTTISTAAVSKFQPGAATTLSLAAKSCVDLQTDGVDYWYQQILSAFQ